jgi:serine/threonine-protein kinase
LAKKSPIEFDWVSIPAGEFLMGSDKARDRQAHDSELPQHSVRLPEFRIARVPVTNAQYVAFVQATGRVAPEHWKDGKIPQGKEQHPVVNVSRHDACALCAWASEVTETPVRLPSEAEWEKAARGTDGRIWPWGNKPPTKELCNFNNNVKDTTPVGAYPRGAGPYGVLDMAGNVWEWTGSLYEPYPYDAADGREDPEAAGLHTLRGGSFVGYDVYVRCAYRDYYFPGDGYDFIGFRVVSPGS